MVNSDGKMPIKSMRKFSLFYHGTLKESGSIFHLIKAYCYKYVNCFRKELSLLVSKCVLEFEKDHTLQFLIALMKGQSLEKYV